MKFAIVSLAVVFNITLVVMYSRSLVGGASPGLKPAPATPVAERSASSPYKPNTTTAGKTAAASPAANRTAAGAESRQSAKSEQSGDASEGKETIDPKDGKETLVPVAEEVRALRLRSDQGRPSAEMLPGNQPRGILAPANPANVDPPVVSPEAR